MYKWSKKPYQKLFKKNDPWQITSEDLINLPKETLGYQTGHFLKRNHFEMQPKLEDHDVIHVLTNTGFRLRKK